MRTIAAAVAAVLLAAACGGGGGPSQAELASFCKAYDEMRDVDTSFDESDLDSMEAALERGEAAIDNTREAAPDELDDDFDVIERFEALDEDDQYKPEEREKYNEAFENIDTFAEEECEL